MLSPKDFGLHLRQVRFRCGYKTVPGLDKEVLTHIERGHRYPTLEELYLIAEGTNMPLWELLPLPEGNKAASHAFALRDVAAVVWDANRTAK